MSKGASGHLKIVIQRIKSNNKSYTILDYLLLCYCKLEELHNLFYLGIYTIGFFLYPSGFATQA